MKKLLVLYILMVAPALFAGGSSYSSSRYGLIEYRPSIRAAGMGGVMIAMPTTTFVNYYNPAGLIGLTTTRFEGSLFYNGNQAESSAGKSFSDLTNLNQLAFAIPFGQNFAASFGLARYSSVDYNYRVSGEFDGEAYQEKYRGNGGIRQLALSFAYRLNPRTSLGLSAQYMMGTINRNWIINWTSDDYENTNDVVGEQIRGVRWVAGGMHHLEKYDLGLVFALPARMERDEALQNATGDTTSYRRVYEGLPFELGVGAVYRGFNGYMVGADLVFSAWNSIEPFGSSQKHRNTLRFGAGAERLPSTSVNAGYFELISYRAGFQVQSLYASNATGKFGTEYLLTTGATVPFNRGKNQLDIAIEVGQRGSLGGLKVRDRILRINLAISGGERWFQNRKKRQ